MSMLFYNILINKIEINLFYLLRFWNDNIVYYNIYKSKIQFLYEFSIPEIDVQLGCKPGDGISFRAVGEGAGASCEIGLTDLAVLDLGTFNDLPSTIQTLTDEQAELISQHKYSFSIFLVHTYRTWHNSTACIWDMKNF